MRDFALNDKQMEIFRATWPNLGWAASEHEERLKSRREPYPGFEAGKTRTESRSLPALKDLHMP